MAVWNFALRSCAVFFLILKIFMRRFVTMAPFRNQISFRTASNVISRSPFSSNSFPVYCLADAFIRSMAAFSAAAAASAADRFVVSPPAPPPGEVAAPVSVPATPEDVGEPERSSPPVPMVPSGFLVDPSPLPSVPAVPVPPLPDVPSCCCCCCCCCCGSPTVSPRALASICRNPAIVANPSAPSRSSSTKSSSSSSSSAANPPVSTTTSDSPKSTSSSSNCSLAS
mmetsp:Transcript_16333/g.22762  ORF Transcript_16333/g.22762 Transcript_16333/m.22762 type:complete len:226 (+) Transcript_16333:257-934(+)